MVPLGGETVNQFPVDVALTVYETADPSVADTTKYCGLTVAPLPAEVNVRAVGPTVIGEAVLCANKGMVLAKTATTPHIVMCFLIDVMGLPGMCACKKLHESINAMRGFWRLWLDPLESCSLHRKSLLRRNVRQRIVEIESEQSRIFPNYGRSNDVKHVIISLFGNLGSVQRK